MTSYIFYKCPAIISSYKYYYKKKAEKFNIKKKNIFQYVGN